MIRALALALILLPSSVLAETNSLRIAFLSCVQHPEQANWQAIEDAQPDMVFFMGDNVYFPSHTPLSAAIMNSHYNRLLNETGFLKVIRRHETYAIWDDHDFGSNNADSTSPTGDVAKQIFRSFWNNPAPPPNLEDSISFKVTKDFVTFLFTDNRSYRKNAESWGSSALFGKKQLDWITSELLNPKTPLVVIVSGGQLLSEGERHENLAEYPKEQQRLFEAFSKSPAKVLILSGDRHFAEVLERNLDGKSIVEATSSPFAGRFAHSLIPSKHNYRKALTLGQKNFGILDMTSITQGIETEITIKDSKGRDLLKHYN